MLKKYIFPKSNELIDITFITFIWAVMFSVVFLRFENTNLDLLSAFVIFFIFLFLLLFLRQVFMKYFAYKNGFEINLKMTYFNMYGFNDYQMLSKKMNKVNMNNRRGMPTPFLSLLLYVITFGFIIYPANFRFELKKIPYMAFGMKKHLESEMYQDITNYRYTQILFFGFLYYFIIALIIKIIPKIFFGEFHLWFLFTTFYIGLITLVPLIGTEGYELFLKGKFAWISSLVILIIGTLSIIVFKSIILTIIVSIFVTLITLFIIKYRELVK